MAAEVLARGGVRVTLVERRRSLARTLLLAGRSGLNLTHTEDLGRFLDRYGDRRPRLEAAIRSFGPDELRAWAAGLGVETWVGSSGRVFPDGMRATPLVRAWIRRLRELGVVIETGTAWLGWERPDDLASSPRRHRLDGPLHHRPTGVRRGDRADPVVPGGGVDGPEPDVVVIALGGASWPNVGGDGSWVAPFRRAGFAVSELRPSNVGVEVAWTPVFRDRFEGQPVKDVELRVGDASARGDVVVTRRGLESGPVYVCSAAIRDELDRHGTCEVTLDLRPDLGVDELARRLARRRSGDSTATWLRRSLGLSPVAIGLLRESTENRVPDDPAEVAALLARLPLRVVATAGIDRAISSAGGVSMDEVDDTFQLHRAPGTYVVGEMLDWDAPTGGYLLQATFSTAVHAATAALDRIDARRTPS